MLAKSLLVYALPARRGRDQTNRTRIPSYALHRFSFPIVVYRARKEFTVNNRTPFHLGARATDSLRLVTHENDMTYPRGPGQAVKWGNSEVNPKNSTDAGTALE